jgi:hypothetical protein
MAKMVRLLFEGTEEICEFVAYFLRKSGIKTEVVPLVGSSADYARDKFGSDYLKGWNPTHTLLIPENKMEEAESIISVLPEYSWYKKRPKSIDATKDSIPQMYGIKKTKKKKRK